MDPLTLIAVLGLHLVTSGVLLAALARQTPALAGFMQVAAGAIVFGCAYGLRIWQGLLVQTRWSVLLDAAMVLASLLLLAGLRRFGGGRALPLPALLAATLVYAVMRETLQAACGPVAPYALLTTTLSTLYATIAWTAHRDRKGAAALLSRPLGGVRSLMAFLALLTLWRAAMALLYDAEMLFRGSLAQAYYAGATVAAVLMGPTFLWLAFAKLNQQLLDVASHDPLTRALNRHGLDEVLQRHFGHRHAGSMTLLQVDVDHFKEINDRHGHRIGDQMLQAIAAALTAQVRAGDFVARTGGEEFLVGCAGASPETALALGERLRRACQETPLPALSKSEIRCTVSVGISRPFMTLAEREVAEQCADAAMYAAKAAGRNRVVMAPLAAGVEPALACTATR